MHFRIRWALGDTNTGFSSESPTPHSKAVTLSGGSVPLRHANAGLGSPAAEVAGTMANLGGAASLD